MISPTTRYLIVLFGLATACGPKAEKKNLNEDIIGEWRNIYLDVSMPTAGNSDSTIVTTCDSSNWEQMLHIKPIRTFFNADGSYRSEYYTLDDSLFRKITGEWKIMNDSIVMKDSNGLEYKMHTVIQNGIAEFDGMLDFDQDGKTDDHYLGRQRKQKHALPN